MIALRSSLWSLLRTLCLAMRQVYLFDCNDNGNMYTTYQWVGYGYENTIGGRLRRGGSNIDFSPDRAESPGSPRCLENVQRRATRCPRSYFGSCGCAGRASRLSPC